jgi:hypothetical protein
MAQQIAVAGIDRGGALKNAARRRQIPDRSKK